MKPFQEGLFLKTATKKNTIAFFAFSKTKCLTQLNQVFLVGILK